MLYKEQKSPLREEQVTLAQLVPKVVVIATQCSKHHQMVCIQKAFAIVMKVFLILIEEIKMILKVEKCSSTNKVIVMKKKYKCCNLKKVNAWYGIPCKNEKWKPTNKHGSVKRWLFEISLKGGKIICIIKILPKNSEDVELTF